MRRELYDNDRKLQSPQQRQVDGHRHLMSIPDEKEIQAMMEDMKNNQKTLKLVS